MTLTNGFDIGSGSTNGTLPGGGAILVEGGSLTLDSVHVTGNRVVGSGGGVIFRGGTHRIIDLTFSANLDEYAGGGISNHSGTLTIVNSTISGNSTFANGVYGGGGFDNRGIATLRNVTITNNRTGGNFSGGGILQAGTLNLGNTIVAGNFSSNGFGHEISQEFAGGVTSVGGNLVGDSPGDSANTNNQYSLNNPPITYHPTDILDTNPQLDILRNNGGTTPTHALLVGSPAVDAGLNALISEAFDQRGAGFSRIRDGNGDGTAIVDIGAFEVQACGQIDTDLDGIMDGCDSDDDNDGQSDATELACGSNPLDAASKCAPSTAGPPTAIEQCKNGGWRMFTIPRRFKNQGDCIQFVNTGK